MKEFKFDSLPKNIDEFLALPESAMRTPFETAALTVLALCAYSENKDAAFAMLDYLRGPRKLSTMDKQFLRDRFMDRKDYIPRSYFVGSNPGNEYTPDLPYRIRVSENSYSYTQENMAKLYLTSAGADSPRPIELRLAKDGKWYLWEQLLLAGIREPESSNPWA